MKGQVFWSYQHRPNTRFPHHFLMTGAAFQKTKGYDVAGWCTEHIGERDKLWAMTAMGDVHLLRDDQATLFKIIWL